MTEESGRCRGIRPGTAKLLAKIMGHSEFWPQRSFHTLKVVPVAEMVPLRGRHIFLFDGKCILDRYSVIYLSRNS